MAASNDRAIERAFEAAVSGYRARTPKSEEHYARACAAMPGGNTRTVLHYDPYPVTVTRGEGCAIWDLDGHRYTDFIGEYSAGLYGHSNPDIAQAVRDALDAGLVLCAPNRYEAELAALLCERFASCERVRFCNSGTEANLMAIGVARVHTGREKVLVFDGAYHGGVFHFAGRHSPANAPFDWLIGRYNDVEAADALIRRHADEIAAILVEPMQGAGGCIPADPAFLRALREASERCGVVLIFDEVMTSRLAPGGLQERFGVTPDMTSFGKYMGGGLSFGAFGGRADVMDRFDPRRPDALPHAGTFNNNVLTMAAGLKGLRDVYTPERALSHSRKGEAFRDGLNELLEKQGAPMHVSGIGSLLNIHFQREPVRSVTEKVAIDPRIPILFHFELLAAGQYVAPRGYMALSLALGPDEYANFRDVFADIVSRHAGVLDA